MTERVVVDGLSVAKVLHDFISKEALPGTGVPEAAFWARLDRLDSRPGAQEPRAAEKARRSAGQDRRVAPRAQGQAVRLARVQGFPQSRSAISFPKAPTSPSTPPASMTRSRASPARNSSCPSPTRATRSTRPTPAGAASTTRSTAPTRCPRTAAPPAAAATIPFAAARCSPGPSASSTRSRPSPRVRTPR